MSALHALSAAELGAAYRQRTLSPVEVTQAVIEHIAAWEPALCATYLFRPEHALEQARASEARWARGAPQSALDGVPLNEWRLDALRRQYSFVSQDVVMFNDTVAANVALGLPLDRARVQQALDAANLGDYVKALPQGMDSPVGHNAAQLSGGQRQRLAIARALYKDAPVWILDEATSALDSESEHQIQQTLRSWQGQRTLILVAHRLSTVRHADRIFVMQDGKVVVIYTEGEKSGTAALQVAQKYFRIK